MEEAAKSAQLQQRQQQQQQQQFLLLQHLQKQQQQTAAVSQFPLNTETHLWPPGNPSHPNVVPNVSHQHHQQGQHQHAQPKHPTSQHNLQQPQQLQQKVIRHGKQLEYQLARQDALQVCRPDFNRPFSSLEDACERLLPYHVVADYETEEDDKILDSDPTGQALSRSQQWDRNISAKVEEFTSTFETQVEAFNMISRKRARGEFRSEERLMVEHTLSQEEKRAMMEARTEIEPRERDGP